MYAGFQLVFRIFEANVARALSPQSRPVAASHRDSHVQRCCPRDIINVDENLDYRHSLTMVVVVKITGVPKSQTAPRKAAPVFDIPSCTCMIATPLT